MSFAPLLDGFRGLRALVIGDLMLDEYVFGKAARISPEAPVIVIRQTSSDRLPGGAANVARNLRALGAETRLVGVVGSDEAGGLLRESLQALGMDDQHLVADPARPTTRKTRVLADSAHQVLRIDHEVDTPVSQSIEERLVASALELVDDSDVIVLSDYLKGTLTAAVASALIRRASDASVPVVVNPKPRSVEFFSGATLVSLNRAEAAEATNKWAGLSDDEAPVAARNLREKHGFGAVLVTLGESGMVASGPADICVPAPRVEVYDTAGAGDTVVATVALGVATAGFKRDVFELAAETAASVVKHVGVATPSQEDLERLRSAQ